ncbi:MAG: glutathione peroxidase, partial [Acidobacteriota bacterium]
VYKTLTTESGDEFQGEIRWNFTKFLIDQDGRVVARFEPDADPLDERVISAIDSLLGDRNQQG